MVSGRGPYSTVIVLQARGTSVGPTTGIYTPISVFWLHGGGNRHGLGAFDMGHCYILHTFRLDFFMQAIHYLDKSSFEFRPNSCMYDMLPLPRGGNVGLSLRV